MKNKGPKSKSRSFLGVLFLSLLSASLIGFLCSRNSLFMLSEFQVLQADPVLEAQVTKKLIPLLGRRLTSLSLREIEEDLQQIPRIRRVLIRKKWPSSLQVTVEEKKAVALAFYGKKLWKVDDKADLIEPLSYAKALPLIVNYKKSNPDLLPVCEWLASQAPTLSVESVEWKTDRGLVVVNKDKSQNFVAELGFSHFAEAWQRLEAARSYLTSKNLQTEFLDASNARRVVVRLKQKLQNFENELNLKELVQRADPSEAAAR